MFQLEIRREALGLRLGLVIADQAGDRPAASPVSRRPLLPGRQFGQKGIGRSPSAHNLEIVAQIVPQPPHIFQLGGGLPGADGQHFPQAEVFLPLTLQLLPQAVQASSQPADCRGRGQKQKGKDLHHGCSHAFR